MDLYPETACGQNSRRPLPHPGIRNRPSPVPNPRVSYTRISGRNQLVGRIVDVRVSGLVAQVTLSVGGQLITSLITSGAVREMHLKKGQTAAALIKATEVMIIRV